jgi:hypothetical protein
MKDLQQRPSEAKRRGTAAITSAGVSLTHNPPHALGAPIALQEQELAYAALLCCVQQAATTSRECKPRARPATAPSRSGQPAPHRNKRVSSRALEQAGVIHRATTGSISQKSCILAHCELASTSRGAVAEARTVVCPNADSSTAGSGKQRAASAGTHARSSSNQSASNATSRRAQSALPTTAAPPPCSAARSFRQGRSAGCYRAVSARPAAAASEHLADGLLLQLPLDVLQFQIDELNKPDWLADSLTAATAAVASAVQARLRLRCNVTLPQPQCTAASELESQSVSSFATAQHNQSQQPQQHLLSESFWPATRLLEHGDTAGSVDCYDGSTSHSLRCCSVSTASDSGSSRSSGSGSGSGSGSSSSSSIGACITTAVPAKHSSTVPAEMLRASFNSLNRSCRSSHACFEEAEEVHEDSCASDSVDSVCSSALLAQACPQELDSLPYLNDVWSSYEADIAAAAVVVGTAEFNCHSSNSSSVADLACCSDYDDLEFTS